jgi:hypothetical protein
MLQFTNYSEISPPVFTLTDASSLWEIAEHESTLSTPLNPAIAQEVLNNLDEFALLPSLSFLERWIVVETVAVDMLAVASVHPGRPLRELLAGEDTASSSTGRERNRHERFTRTLKAKILGAGIRDDEWFSKVRSVANKLTLAFTSIPPEIFERCAHIVGEASHALRAAHPSIPWDTYGFGLEKGHGEALVDLYGTASFLARSNFGVERTLLYYEVAAAAGVSLILHPNRFEEVLAIDSASVDAYAAVRDVIRRTVEEPVRRQLETLGIKQSIACPALIAKLITEAGKQGMSIVDVARAIKDSREARSFRQWLSGIEDALNSGTTAGRMQALRMLRELQNVATSWAEELDVTLGSKYKRRQLHLSWIPRIGGLLEMLKAPTIKDPILNRKGYLTFMSSWFET